MTLICAEQRQTVSHNERIHPVDSGVTVPPLVDLESFPTLTRFSGANCLTSDGSAGHESLAKKRIQQDLDIIVSLGKQKALSKSGAKEHKHHLSILNNKHQRTFAHISFDTWSHRPLFVSLFLLSFMLFYNQKWENTRKEKKREVFVCPILNLGEFPVILVRKISCSSNCPAEGTDFVVPRQLLKLKKGKEKESLSGFVP